MKAQPLKLVDGQYIPCEAAEATHLRIKMPGPSKYSCLPIITSGNRRETPCWTWNGSVDSPTLAPSILTRFDSGDPTESYVCHSFVTDGMVQFLSDCTHGLAGETVPLTDL
jgi:hypothetical protein